LTRLRGRSPFGAAKARASINLRKNLSKRMDYRVKPGNDEVDGAPPLRARPASALLLRVLDFPFNVSSGA